MISTNIVIRYFRIDFVPTSNFLLRFFVLSMAAYAMVPYFYYYILESGTALGTTDALFNAGSQLTIAAMGYTLRSQ